MTRTVSLFIVTLVLCCQIHASDEKGTVVTINGIKSRTPGDWKAVKPKYKTRLNEFKVPRTDDDKKDAEVTVSYFGPDQGGTAEDNIKRWKSQFRPPAGKTIDEVAKVEKFKVGDADITYVDVSGTFLSRFPPFDPNGKVTAMPNYRALSVYFDTKDGVYFLRLSGPAKTVSHNKKGFDSWVKGFK
jgi:hypothetical protein